MVAAGAVALVMAIGGSASKSSAPAIAGAATNLWPQLHPPSLLGDYLRPSTITAVERDRELGDESLTIRTFVFYRATAGSMAGSTSGGADLRTSTGTSTAGTVEPHAAAPVPVGLWSCESSDFVDIVLDRCR